VVEGARDSTRRKRFKASSAPTFIVLQQHQHVESRAPSTTVRSLRELQWSRSPAIAGAEGANDRVLAARCTRVLQQERKPLMFCLQINKGRRSAGRRKSNGPHHTNRCCHPSALRARRAPRTTRLREPSASGALASRRSTAALAVVSRPRLVDFRPGFLGRGSVRALPALAYPSPAAAPRAPAVIPADMMPKAARERFARPPAGTALAPLSGSHLESALVERDGGAVSRDADEGQARSTN
jgi:hypothetical protein